MVATAVVAAGVLYTALFVVDLTCHNILLVVGDVATNTSFISGELCVGALHMRHMFEIKMVVF